MNYYEVLGVSADATDQQIKEAYRREAMRWHPDRHDGVTAKAHAERRFKDLALAYRTLRDPAARTEYDHLLKQKLQQEYEDRQREQARAEHERAQARQREAQDQQAKSTQSSQKQPEQDETQDYANQMFFEQMLDLAFELAGRKFPEAHIVKALIVLGCPDSMARAVATLAIGRKKYNATSGESDVFPNMEFSSLAPRNIYEEKIAYYKALIGSRNQTYYLRRFADFDSGGGRAGWPGAMRFLLGFIFWHVYRKIHPGIIFFIVALSLLPIFYEKNEVLYTLSNFSIWIVSALYMDYLYYWSVNRHIDFSMRRYSSEADRLQYLTQRGGVRRWILYFVLLISIIGIAAAIAIPAYNDYTARAIAAQNAANKAAEEQARQLAERQAKAQAEIQAKAEYDRILDSIEKQFPQLNPDSPKYNSKDMGWIVSKMKSYQDEGRGLINALRLAVADYSLLLQQQRSQPTNQYRQSRIQESVELFNGKGDVLSLNFRNSDIRPILQIFSDFVGIRILLDRRVMVSVDVEFRNQPWNGALLQLLRKYELSIIKVSGGYYVFPSDISDEIAYQRGMRMSLGYSERTTQGNSEQGSDQIIIENASETFCRTWPSACR